MLVSEIYPSSSSPRPLAVGDVLETVARKSNPHIFCTYLILGVQASRRPFDEATSTPGSVQLATLHHAYLQKAVVRCNNIHALSSEEAKALLPKSLSSYTRIGHVSPELSPGLNPYVPCILVPD